MEYGGFCVSWGAKNRMVMKEQQMQIRYAVLAVSELEGEDLRLYRAAWEASGRAYAPYSRFRVGAAALLGDGTVVTGANQENAAYPSGLCAERVALFSAGADYPDVPVVALAVIARTDDGAREAVSPCGACCQVLTESEARSRRPMRVLLCGRDTVRVLESVSSLLPFSFSASDLP